jgi:hypothetical protein
MAGFLWRGSLDGPVNCVGAIFLAQRGKLFWIGLLMYAVSFFLAAVVSSSDRSETERGYTCAYIAMWYIWSAPKWLPHLSVSSLLQLFPIVVAGLINPIFLLAAIRPSPVLRTTLVVMIPFCWIVFIIWTPTLYPREGHFLWLAGISLVLFSDWNSGRDKTSAMMGTDERPHPT